MTHPAIVLSVSQCKIINDTTGELETSGTTVRYLLANNLTHTEDATRPVKVLVPAKATLPFENFDQFATVPGLYDATLDFAVDSKGKAVLSAQAFDFVSAIGISKTSANKLNLGVKET